MLSILCYLFILSYTLIIYTLYTIYTIYTLILYSYCLIINIDQHLLKFYTSFTRDENMSLFEFYDNFIRFLPINFLNLFDISSFLSVDHLFIQLILIDNIFF
jgi:hypothetical protein